MITTYAQLQKRSSGIELRIYLKVDRDHWYYFNYNFDRQQLRVYSSLGEWNDLIRNLSEKDRIVEGKSEQGIYRFSLGTKNDADNFARYIMNVGSADAATYEESDEEEDSDGE